MIKIKKIRLLIATVLTLVLAHTSAFALLYPKIESPNLEVIYVGDARVDLEMRLKFYREAKKSISIVSFSQSIDNVGAPVIKALREASNRNVNVHFMFDSVATGLELEGDSKGYAAQLLADPALARPANVIRATAGAKLLNGLFIDDFIHEKIIIIDEGTPDVKVLLTGRGHTQTAVDFEDSTFLMRPIDSSQAWAGEEVIDYYKRVWKAYQKIFSKFKGVTPSPKAMAALHRPFHGFLKTDSQKAAYKNLIELINAGPVTSPHQTLSDIQFHPKTFQLTSNDALQNAIKYKAGYFVGNRNQLPDDTMKLIKEMLPQTKNLFMSAYGFGLPSMVKDAFMKFVADGKEFTLVTNSMAAFKKVTKPNTFSRVFMEAASDYTVKGIIPFLDKSAEIGKDNMKVYRSSPPDAEDELKAARYLHHKFIVLDDTVGVGSDNYTASAARKNNEITAFMEDSRLSKYLREEVHYELDSRYTKLTQFAARAELYPWSFCSYLLQGAVKQGL